VADINGRLFIDGQWRDGAARLPVINPATEETLGSVAAAGTADIDDAVAAARTALSGPWGSLSARDRGRFLARISQRIVERIDEFARLETLHTGKPIFESRQIEMPAVAECFEYYAGWADKIHGETIPVKGSYLTYTLREPIGVVAAIVPWNFPLLLTAWKVAPALACGNTVVIEPATQTPLTALALAEAAQEVGLPPGVINVVTGRGSEIGDYHRPRASEASRRSPRRCPAGRGTARVDRARIRPVGRAPGLIFSAGRPSEVQRRPPASVPA
jgi:aldehyde dehydrogenase (NAD+)